MLTEKHLSSIVRLLGKLVNRLLEYMNASYLIVWKTR
jgi:hypothetical protein